LKTDSCGWRRGEVGRWASCSLAAYKTNLKTNCCPLCAFFLLPFSFYWVFFPRMSTLQDFPFQHIPGTHLLLVAFWVGFVRGAGRLLFLSSIFPLSKNQHKTCKLQAKNHRNKPSGGGVASTYRARASGTFETSEGNNIWTSTL